MKNQNLRSVKFETVLILSIVSLAMYLALNHALYVVPIDIVSAFLTIGLLATVFAYWAYAYATIKKVTEPAVIRMSVFLGLILMCILILALYESLAVTLIVGPFLSSALLIQVTAIVAMIWLTTVFIIALTIFILKVLLN